MELVDSYTTAGAVSVYEGEGLGRRSRLCVRNAPQKDTARGRTGKGAE